MKNRLFLVLFALFFARFAFADGESSDTINWPVTLGPEFECEEVVAYLKDVVDSICRDLSGWESYYHTLGDSHSQVYEMATDTTEYNNQPAFKQRLDYYNTVFNDTRNLMFEDLNYANEEATNLLDNVYQINCADCVIGDQPPGTNSNNCCDFTGLYARLDQLIQIQTQIQTYAQRLQTIDQNLEYSVFLLEHGFQSVTNLLRTTGIVDSMYDTWNYYYDSGWVSDVVYYPLSSFPSVSELLESLTVNNMAGLSSINNFIAERYDAYFLTSLEAPSPLFRFGQQSQYTDYYTYLTNYYFGMVREDADIPADHKDNWFTRIETLLAALVFSDSSNTDTNTVDASSGERERTQLSDSVTTANQGAATFNTSFKSASQSITQLYQSYFTTFETAAMPSHIVLMRLSSNEGEDIEVAFQSDSLGILVEGCRVVTTFAWASVGILLLYKFLVWAGRCIVVTCQFIYRVISSVFKS